MLGSDLVICSNDTTQSCVSNVPSSHLFAEQHSLFTPGIDQSLNINARKILQKIVSRIVIRIVAIDGKAATADQDVARLSEERGDNQTQQLYSE